MSVKSMLKRLPPVVALYRLWNQPRQALARHAALRGLRRDYAGLAEILPTGSAGRLLALGLQDDSIEPLKLEAFLVKGLQCRGMDCQVLGSRAGWGAPAYRALGVPGRAYLDDFLEQARTRLAPGRAQELLDRVDSFAALCALESEGVKLGKYVASTLMRRCHTGVLDVADPATRLLLRESLEQSLAVTLAGKLLLDALRPDVCLFLERGYSPFGELFDLAILRGLDVIQWCGSQRPDAFVFKRFTPGNLGEHPHTLSAKTWAMLKNAPCSPAMRQAVFQELFDGYASGGWFSEVGTQFRTTVLDKDAAASALGLDPGKKTAVLFAHMFWDATLFYGTDVFRDYEEWFVESVKAACRNPALNWVIKMHPANLVKLSRDGYQGELAEAAVIRREIGELPLHVRLVYPDTPISTYALFSLMDFCLTVRGTVGIEAAASGVPVLTCGTGRYDRLGFTVDSTDRDEYLDRLARLQDLPGPTLEQTDLAVKYAFGVFVLRRFNFTNLRIVHNRDAAVSMTSEIVPRTIEEFMQAKDLQAFADWVLDSRDEDYLDAGALQLVTRSSHTV